MQHTRKTNNNRYAKWHTPNCLYQQNKIAIKPCFFGNATEAAAEKRPVIVWIYGGGFETGGTADPQYDCSNLVKENPEFVFVTINYRVSFFGFLHLSHLPDGKDYTDF